MYGQVECRFLARCVEVTPPNEIATKESASRIISHGSLNNGQNWHTHIAASIGHGLQTMEANLCTDLSISSVSSCMPVEKADIGGCLVRGDKRRVVEGRINFRKTIVVINS